MRQDSVWKSLVKDVTAVVKQPLVEIAGRNRVLIENHNGVSGYETNCIGVEMEYGHLTITGRELNLAQITLQQLVITGEIEKVSLCGGDDSSVAKK